MVDDLWDAKAWDIISCAFPENRAGSRVIVTTRLEEVASRACGFHRECIYRMKPLSNQDARRLFFNRIFGCEDDCPSQFEEISAEILNKCGGLPLAIITIAGLLASRPVKLKEWECILNSLSMQIGTNATLARVREILDLSYKNLPHHLKTCLLYLSLYPEDYEIKRNDLIRQWVSEGFVRNLHGQDSDDVAKSYFNELINRSLVQPESTDLGEVLSCRVHDMMMDLILCKCEEDNFVTVVYNSEGVARHHDRKVRRLSLSFSDVDGNVAVGAIIPGTDATSLSHIRSLAMLGKFYYMPHLLMFKYLRVLIIDTSFSTSIFMLDLTCITQLFLLRYLKIDLGSQSHLPTVQLPHKIQGLVYLEMLEIKHCYLERIPSDIIYLPCLSHLTVDLCCNLIDGLHNMKSLHTLVGFPLELDRNIRCLGALRELRVLTFKTTYGHTANKAWMDAFLSSLGKLRNLRYLEVNDGSLGAFGRGNQLNSLSHPPLHLEQLLLWGWRLSRIPRWINGDLKKLCRLSLVIKDTSTEEVRVLGELPSLIDLQLDMHDAPHWRRIRPRPMIVFGVGSFPALEDLDFHYGNDATSSMCFEALGVLPQLRRLTLRLWTHSWGGAAPVGMEHLLNLQHIHLVEHYWGQHCWMDNDSDMVCFFTNYAAQVHPSRPSLSTDGQVHNKRPLEKA